MKVLFLFLNISKLSSLSKITILLQNNFETEKSFKKET